MNPTSNQKLAEFSLCSQKDICAYYDRIAKPCMVDPQTGISAVNATAGKVYEGIKTADTVCGNGIKEEGEECDCGTDAECLLDNCCTVGCKLRPSAKCR
jgi:hypothetical protein